jgi:hypothetical protein
LSGCTPLRLSLAFGGYSAGAIVEPDLTVVGQKLIPPEAAREAVTIFQEHRIDCWVFVGKSMADCQPKGFRRPSRIVKKEAARGRPLLGKRQVAA